MKIVQINDGCGIGSIGKISVAISKLLTEKEVENYILYSSYDKSTYPLGIKYTNKYYIKLQALLSRVTGRYGFVSGAATRKLLRELKKIKPDVVHLHNLHAHNVNLNALFKYIRENNIKAYWTFHDCWAMTGYCPHFTMAGCDKWMTGCGDCPQRRDYTWFFDKSAKNWSRKKELIESVDMTVITPSDWLADIVKKSYFKNCPIYTLYNGINLNVFTPTESDFREKYGIQDKIVLLGVAFAWTQKKGLDVFLELSKRLDKNYQIVLVGTDDETDKQLPGNIISIHRTKNQRELAEIYSSADILVNPTREDTFPTVNMEAIACGTPVVSFDVGGCRETIAEGCGECTEENTVDNMEALIRKVYGNVSKYVENCNKNREIYDECKRISRYLQIYGIE